MEGFRETERKRFPMFPKETTSSTSMVTLLDDQLKGINTQTCTIGNDLETRKIQIEQIQLTGIRKESTYYH